MPATQVLPTITISARDCSLVPSLRCMYCVVCYEKTLDAMMSSLDAAVGQPTYTFAVDPRLGVVLCLPGPYLLSAKRKNSSAVALDEEGRYCVPRF